MIMGIRNNNYNYPFRYCNSHKLCEEHGISDRTLERWISEEKDKGKTIPGRIKVPGTRAFIFDPVIFHKEFFLPKILGETRNEYEALEHRRLLIINNKKERKAI